MPARLILMYAVLPLWILAGLADWACHRASAIERTSGLKENLLHWLLFAQMGVALALVVLLQVNAAILLAFAGMFAVHELTVHGELRCTAPLRNITPLEQMVHSFMELLPLMVLALLAVLHWDQVRAAVQGMGDYSLAAKPQPWPAVYLGGLAAAVLAFNVLPLAEETRRCLRARTRRILGPR